MKRVSIGLLLALAGCIIFLTANSSAAPEKDKKEEDDKFTSEDFQDAMMTSNKMMKYILPIMIFSVSMVTSLGISIYWAFNSMVDIGKIYLLKEIVNKKLEKDAKGKV